MLVATKMLKDLCGKQYLFVEVATTATVDRKHVAGWLVGKPGKASDKLADRLVAAILAGKAITVDGVLTDVRGKTYLGTTHNVVGRRMNADLVRLGF